MSQSENVLQRMISHDKNKLQEEKYKRASLGEPRFMTRSRR